MAQSHPVGLRSRKHIHLFDLLRPTSVDEALTATLPDGRSALMAGGLDLIDRMKCGEAFERLIFLDGIAALKGIRRLNGKIVIGALTTHARIATDNVLADVVQDLPTLWRTIANPRVRYTGTIGGNLMSGSPHYDAAPALLALGAEAQIHTPDGPRTIGIDQVHDHPGALLQSVSLDDRGAVRLLADRSLHPTLSIYLAAYITEKTLRTARIAVGCAYARPVAVDLPITGQSLPAIAAKAAGIARAAADALPDTIIGDGGASAAYRRRMCDVLIRRLLIRLGATA